MHYTSELLAEMHSAGVYLSQITRAMGQDEIQGPSIQKDFQHGGNHEGE